MMVVCQMRRAATAPKSASPTSHRNALYVVARPFSAGLMLAMPATRPEATGGSRRATPAGTRSGTRARSGHQGGTGNVTAAPSRRTKPQVTMGGAEGTRTPDPHTASVVRYQLRHSPMSRAGQATARLLMGRVSLAARPRPPETRVSARRRGPARAGCRRCARAAASRRRAPRGPTSSSWTAARGRSSSAAEARASSRSGSAPPRHG
jgi:hypothetical protein